MAPASRAVGVADGAGVGAATRLTSLFTTGSLRICDCRRTSSRTVAAAASPSVDRCWCCSFSPPAVRLLYPNREEDDDEGMTSDSVVRMTSMTTRFWDEYWSVEKKRGSSVPLLCTLGWRRKLLIKVSRNFRVEATELISLRFRMLWV